MFICTHLRHFRRLSACLLVVLCSVGLAAARVAAAPRIVVGAQNTQYATPELLRETDWVALHGSDPSVRLVDMRDAAAYAAGHIPGAVRLDEGPLRNTSVTDTYLPAPTAFAALMGKAGIGPETHVVIYDDQGSRVAARLWYVLSTYGHTKVSLVNGGWKKWVAEKRAVSTETPIVTLTRFVPVVTPLLSCPAPEITAKVPGALLLDTRAPDEFEGKRATPGVRRPGRIPGAVNVEWKENVGGEYLTFKSAAELKKLYEAKGITPDKEIITHCATGGRAAQTLFTLKLLGYPKVRLYYGSFTDYSSRPDTAIETSGNAPTPAP